MNLLLAAALLMQDKTAEETFKKIEESILKAKTLTVKYRMLYKNAGDTAGFLILAQGNKVFSRDAWFETNGHVMVSGCSCDGKQIAARNNAYSEWETHQTAPDLGEEVRIELARDGIWGAVTHPLFIVRNGFGAEDGKVKKSLVTSDFRSEPGEGKDASLSYSIAETHLNHSGRIRLWYDPRTLALIKRELRMRFGGSDHDDLFAEIYDEFTLNANIPDEKFKLPEEKK